MSEEKKTDAPSLTLADIRKLVTDTVGDVMKNITPSEGKPKEDTAKPDNNTGRSIKEQVEAEIQRIKGKEERETRDKTIDEQLKTLSERTAEKPPVERRRVHRIMGWGE